jgi:hypothetical protein
MDLLAMMSLITILQNSHQLGKDAMLSSMRSSHRHVVIHGTKFTSCAEDS